MACTLTMPVLGHHACVGARPPEGPQGHVASADAQRDHVSIEHILGARTSYMGNHFGPKYVLYECTDCLGWVV